MKAKIYILIAVASWSCNSKPSNNLAFWEGIYKSPDSQELTLRLQELKLVGIYNDGSNAEVEILEDGQVIIDGAKAYLKGDSVFLVVEGNGATAGYNEKYFVRKKANGDSDKQLSVSARLVYKDGTLSDFDVINDKGVVLWNVYVGEEAVGRKPSDKTKIILSGKYEGLNVLITNGAKRAFLNNNLSVDGKYEIVVENTACEAVEIVISQKGTQLFNHVIEFGCGE
jgi:hypothetical protein